MTLNGMNIVISVYARDVRTTFRVERHPIKKRRRQWRVVKFTIDKPGCYVVGNTYVIHPEIYREVKSATVGERNTCYFVEAGERDRKALNAVHG